MNFMEIAIISVLGFGMCGILGVLIQHLLSQNAQRSGEHKDSMAAITAQGKESRDHADRLHAQAMAAITEQSKESRDHADRLHAQAMAAITEQGKESRDHADRLHAQAMAAITASDRENRRHREKLHTDVMAEISSLRVVSIDLGERASALEAVTGLRSRPNAQAERSGRPSIGGLTQPQSSYAPA